MYRVIPSILHDKLLFPEDIMTSTRYRNAMVNLKGGGFLEPVVGAGRVSACRGTYCHPKIHISNRIRTDIVLSGTPVTRYRLIDNVHMIFTIILFFFRF